MWIQCAQTIACCLYTCITSKICKKIWISEAMQDGADAILNLNYDKNMGQCQILQNKGFWEGQMLPILSPDSYWINLYLAKIRTNLYLVHKTKHNSSIRQSCVTPLEVDISDTYFITAWTYMDISSTRCYMHWSSYTLETLSYNPPSHLSHYLLTFLQKELPTFASHYSQLHSKTTAKHTSSFWEQRLLFHLWLPVKMTINTE